MKIQKNTSIPIPVNNTGSSMIKTFSHNIGRIQINIVPIPKMPPIIYPNNIMPPIIFPLPAVNCSLLSCVILNKSKIDTIINRIPRSKLFQIIINIIDVIIRVIESQLKYCFITLHD